MALSADFINQLLKQFAQTSSGQTAMKNFFAKHGASAVDTRKADALAQQMVALLGDHIRSVIPSFDTSAIHALPAAPDKNGNLKIQIVIDEDALWRDSLSPNPAATDTSGWKNYATKNGRLGTDNIVLQFAKGWDTGMKAVFGEWHGHYVESAYLRAPSDFLLSAVSEFNRSAPKGVKAKLEEKYK